LPGKRGAVQCRIERIKQLTVAFSNGDETHHSKARLAIQPGFSLPQNKKLPHPAGKPDRVLIQIYTLK